MNQIKEVDEKQENQKERSFLQKMEFFERQDSLITKMNKHYTEAMLCLSLAQFRKVESSRSLNPISFQICPAQRLAHIITGGILQFESEINKSNQFILNQCVEEEEEDDGEWDFEDGKTNALFQFQNNMSLEEMINRSKAQYAQEQQSNKKESTEKKKDQKLLDKKDINPKKLSVNEFIMDKFGFSNVDQALYASQNEFVKLFETIIDIANLKIEIYEKLRQVDLKNIQSKSSN